MYLTYSEIRAIMKAKDVELRSHVRTTTRPLLPSENAFANSGGVTAAVLESLKESDNCDRMQKSVKCKWFCRNVRKPLLLMKVGRLPEDFIEGMACDGGCVGGPSCIQ